MGDLLSQKQFGVAEAGGKRETTCSRKDSTLLDSAPDNKYFEIPSSGFLCRYTKPNQAELIKPGLIRAKLLLSNSRGKKAGEKSHHCSQGGALNTLKVQSLSSFRGRTADGGLSEGRVWSEMEPKWSPQLNTFYLCRTPRSARGELPWVFLGCFLPGLRHTHMCTCQSQLQLGGGLKERCGVDKGKEETDII